jgi:hypothetical protein
MIGKLGIGQDRRKFALGIGFDHFLVDHSLVAHQAQIDLVEVKVQIACDFDLVFCCALPVDLDPAIGNPAGGAAAADLDPLKEAPIGNRLWLCNPIESGPGVGGCNKRASCWLRYFGFEDLGALVENLTKLFDQKHPLLVQRHQRRNILALVLQGIELVGDLITAVP